ncbi:MAG: DNA cytosine methyltransferase [Pseudomonadota bacterium]
MFDVVSPSKSFSFYEFFAGGGLARRGFEQSAAPWTCAFANDVDPMKARAYRAAFGDDVFQQGDVAALTVDALPGRADLAWASFPCQDLSLAGARGGLAAARSGTFFAFWRLMEALRREGRGPRILVLENVVGLLTSRGGADFAALAEHLSAAGYAWRPHIIDAAAFVPQSRPRLFVTAFAPDADVGALAESPGDAFHPPALARALQHLPEAARAGYRPFALPTPPRRNANLIDIVDAEPEGVPWHGPEATEKLLALMAPRHRAEAERRRASGVKSVGAVFRRMRRENGASVQRAEVRFDGLAGCLRTPAGGSSRQTLLVIEDGRIRSRLLSPREAARLMGLADDHPLPPRPTAAFKVCGDGVAVPVVAWLADHLLAPALAEAYAASASPACGGGVAEGDGGGAMARHTQTPDFTTNTAAPLPNSPPLAEEGTKAAPVLDEL